MSLAPASLLPRSEGERERERAPLAHGQITQSISSEGKRWEGGGREEETRRWNKKKRRERGAVTGEERAVTEGMRDTLLLLLHKFKL